MEPRLQQWNTDADKQAGPEKTEKEGGSLEAKAPAAAAESPPLSLRSAQILPAEAAVAPGLLSTALGGLLPLLLPSPSTEGRYNCIVRNSNTSGAFVFRSFSPVPVKIGAA